LSTEDITAEPALAAGGAGAVRTVAAETLIEAGAYDRSYWRDLWRYRELLFFLAWRDLSVRYRQAVFGIAWGVMRPLASMVVYAIVFGVLARLPSNDAPYAVVVLVGLLPWQFFTTALNDSGSAVLQNAGLIGKIYFPRLIMPLAGIMPSLVDLAISAGLLVLVMLYYGILPSWRMLLLPLLITPAALAALGVGLWSSAMNVSYRDVSFAMPLALQLGFFLSPVAYTIDLIPESWRTLYSLNPLVGVIEGCRWAVIGGPFHLAAWKLVVSGVGGLALLAVGVAFFRKSERVFADVI